MPRRKLEIDEKKIAALAFDGARNSEIADILGIDAKTLTNRFSRLLDKTRAERRVMLRKAQTTAARRGNTGMLVWLGKQELDQVDRPAPRPPPDSDIAVDLTADDPTPAQ